jgi:hypothetical protein
LALLGLSKDETYRLWIGSFVARLAIDAKNVRVRFGEWLVSTGPAVEGLRFTPFLAGSLLTWNSEMPYEKSLANIRRHGSGGSEGGGITTK